MGALEEPTTSRYKYGDITIGGRTIKFPPLSDRDPAGELGTCEDDMVAELGNDGLSGEDFLASLPDYSPDLHGYIRLHTILIRVAVVALVFIAGLLIGHFL